MNLNFDFGVLAQKCLKPCVNGDLKFQFLDAQASHDLMIVTDSRTDIPKPNLPDLTDLTDFPDISDLPGQQQQQQHQKQQQQ